MVDTTLIHSQIVKQSFYVLFIICVASPEYTYFFLNPAAFNTKKDALERNFSSNQSQRGVQWVIC